MWLRSNEDEIEIGDLDENVEWAAPADSRGEGEQNIAIAEMAMESLSYGSESENDLSEVQDVLHSETIDEHDSELDWVDENPLLSPPDEPKD